MRNNIKISCIALLCLLSKEALTQELFDQPSLQSIGLKLGFVDVRGEIATRLDGFYIGTELGLEYSSTFNFSPLWHYYGELSYYTEEINPNGSTLHYLQGYSARATGIAAMAGVKYFLFSNAEFLKIKYDENGGWSLLPYLAGGIGASYSGAELINGADTLDFGYVFSEGASLGIFGEGTFGLDLYFNNNYKISGYASGRLNSQDDLDGLIGTGPFPDILFRIGVGFHYLF